jgi:hypothetical protein
VSILVKLKREVVATEELIRVRSCAYLNSEPYVVDLLLWFSGYKDWDFGW